MRCPKSLDHYTIVDATIIAAAPSTKNRAKQHDPEMHQTKKGSQYDFGLKVHIGTDAASGLAHSIKATSANVADVTMDDGPKKVLRQTIEKTKASIRPHTDIHGLAEEHFLSLGNSPVLAAASFTQVFFMQGR